MSSRLPLALAVWALCIAPAASAQNGTIPLTNRAGITDPRSVAPPLSSATPSVPTGLMVFIDPVTGKIREPLPGEVNELVPTGPQIPAPRAMTAQQAPISLPGGGVGMVLDESSHSYVVVTKKPDGTILMDCLPDGKGANDAVTKGLNTGEALQKTEVLDVQ